jgi:SAM-dependent methyltransferase
VADGEALPFPDDAYQVAISTETLEHVRRPWRFVAEMVRVLEPGGHLLLTTVGYSFPEHDVPHDYWRFGHGALEGLVADAGAVVLETLDRLPDHIYILGRKVLTP